MGSEMNKRAEKVEVAVEELKESAPSSDNSGVVLETEAVVNGNRHDTAIEVAHDDVPAVSRRARPALDAPRGAG